MRAADQTPEHGEDALPLDAALRSVGADPGLHQLVPYLAQFFAVETMQALRSLPRLAGCLRLAAALLGNGNLHCDPYVHQLMPGVLTCLLGAPLGAEGDAPGAVLAVRRLAATLVAKIAADYGPTYATLVPRLTKTFVHAWLDPERPLPTHLGALLGLRALGARAEEALVLTNAEPYLQVLVPALGNGGDAVARAEARAIFRTLTAVAGAYVHRQWAEVGDSFVTGHVQPTPLRLATDAAQSAFPYDRPTFAALAAAFDGDVLKRFATAQVDEEAIVNALFNGEDIQ